MGSVKSYLSTNSIEFTIAIKSLLENSALLYFVFSPNIFQPSCYYTCLTYQTVFQNFISCVRYTVHININLWDFIFGRVFCIIKFVWYYSETYITDSYRTIKSVRYIRVSVKTGLTVDLKLIKSKLSSFKEASFLFFSWIYLWYKYCCN